MTTLQKNNMDSACMKKMTGILFTAAVSALSASAGLSDSFRIPLDDTIQIIVWQSGETRCKLDQDHLESVFVDLVRTSCPDRSLGDSDSKMLFYFNWKTAENAFGQNVDICVSPFVMQFGKSIDSSAAGGRKGLKMFVEQEIYFSSALHQFDNRDGALGDVSSFLPLLREACGYR
jgi:hypothetical protein